MSDHRLPRDLQDLLRLAVEHQEARDNQSEADTPSNAASDSERQQWLADAINSFQNDPISEMKKGIKVLQDAIEKLRNDEPEATLEEEVTYTLDTLIDYVGSIDYANDFIKLGGNELFVPLLTCRSHDIKMKTCELFAEIVQNNCKAQASALEGNMLAELTNILDKETSEQVRIKALYAISCLIRDNKDAARRFDTDHDGLSVLLRAMQQETETHKLRIKSSFLITALCVEDNVIKETLFKMGFVEQLIALLHNEHNQSHEYLLSALNALVSGHEGSMRECRRPELGLEALLRHKLTVLNGNPAYSEERYFANEVLKQCFPNSEPMEEER